MVKYPGDCDELVEISPDKVLNYSNFNANKKEFKEFTEEWFNKAKEADNKDNNPFMALISLWIPFNSWLTHAVNRQVAPTKFQDYYKPLPYWYLVESACRDRGLSEKL